MPNLPGVILLVLVGMAAAPVFAGDTGRAGTTEFCLDGEFNLGAQMQGYDFGDEWVPTRWCVITEGSSNRAMFSATGKSNPDMDGNWQVAFLPPDLVRIVNRASPPDVEFHGTANPDEARRIRRIDPRRLLEEVSGGDADIPGLSVRTADGRVSSVVSETDYPLTGRAELTWRWGWSDPAHPIVEITTDNNFALFRATGSWRDVPEEEVAALWQASEGADPIEVPGDRWPSRINMQLINLTDDVYLVRGVRTGFQHMVVVTSDGLVVADAPTGWVEFHHLPPADLVPGLGERGLSGEFIDYLAREFDGRPVAAVALTHFHGDHAGGAAVFANAGADVYAPAATGERLSAYLGIPISPVDDSITIGDPANEVRLLSMNDNPHVSEMLGVWAVNNGYFFVSDIHVPNSDDAAPRPERAMTECWFAAWAVNNLPSDVRVVNSHSASVTPVARLAEYLEHPLCSPHLTP